LPDFLCLWYKFTRRLTSLACRVRLPSTTSRFVFNRDLKTTPAKRDSDLITSKDVAEYLPEAGGVREAGDGGVCESKQGKRNPGRAFSEEVPLPFLLCKNGVRRKVKVEK